MISPVPLHETPLFLRIFGFKKWRYRLNNRWMYASDIHEVARQLKKHYRDRYWEEDDYI